MQVTERFLKYVSFDTTSSETSDTVPTTAHQRVLGQYLADADAAGKGKEVENKVQVGNFLWDVEERAHRVADAAGEQKPERAGRQHRKEVADVEDDGPAEQDVDERGEPFRLALAHEALENDAHDGDRTSRLRPSSKCACAP